MIRALQINVDRGRAAMELLHKTAEDNKTNIILVAEPNRKLVKKGGAGEGFVWLEMQEVVIYGCYMSPNIGIERYLKFLNDLRESMRRHNKEVIVGSDFMPSLTYGVLNRRQTRRNIS
nr:unnamed protein product [Callosobruchus analis]